MDVVVPSARDVEPAAAVLVALGYKRKGDQGIPGREAFSILPGLPYHHLYRGLQWQDVDDPVLHVHYLGNGRSVTRPDHNVRPGVSRSSPKLIATGWFGTMTTMSAAISEIIMTADDAAWLTTFTRQLVEERWCACAQRINPIQSTYRWDGTVHEDAETRVALHTRADLVPALISRIKEDHAYDVPCILAFQIDQANPDYEAWVEAETRPAL